MDHVDLDSGELRIGQTHSYLHQVSSTEADLGIFLLSQRGGLSVDFSNRRPPTLTTVYLWDCLSTATTPVPFDASIDRMHDTHRLQIVLERGPEETK